MPTQRKVFRIEQMLGLAPTGPEPAAACPAPPAERQQENILAELRALRALLERRPSSAAVTEPTQAAMQGLRQLKDETDTIHRAINETKQEIASLYAGTFDGGGEARATRELDAVVASAETATQKILSAAEMIEEAAASLSASVEREQDQALAQDIQDQVVRIFEACNFQDLSGQRITKVLATLKFVEEHIARMMEIWGGIEAFKDYTAAAAAAHNGEIKMANGPKLDGDRGHVSQNDIDRMFAER
jgi:chemotaxis protein CheZ